MTNREWLEKMAKSGVIDTQKISNEEYERLKDDSNVYVYKEEPNGYVLEESNKKAEFNDEHLKEKLLFGIYKNTKTIKNIIIFYFVCSIIAGVLALILMLK